MRDRRDNPDTGNAQQRDRDRDRDYRQQVTSKLSVEAQAAGAVAAAVSIMGTGPPIANPEECQHCLTVAVNWSVAVCVVCRAVLPPQPLGAEVPSGVVAKAPSPPLHIPDSGWVEPTPTPPPPSPSTIAPPGQRSIAPPGQRSEEPCSRLVSSAVHAEGLCPFCGWRYGSHEPT